MNVWEIARFLNQYNDLRMIEKVGGLIYFM